MIAIRRIVISVLLLALAACSQANAEPPHRDETAAIDVTEELSLTDIQAYLWSVQSQQIVEYVRTAELAEFLASLPPPPPPVQDYTPVTSTATGSCGGATNGADRYISRETNGSSDPVNQYNLQGSGAWGCYQLMPEHFAPGGTCDDMVYGQASAEQQAACASRLPLSAWGG